MAENTDPAGAEKYRKLPPVVKLEDTIATHDPIPPQDPKLGRDTETEFLLRHGVG